MVRKDLIIPDERPAYTQSLAYRLDILEFDGFVVEITDLDSPNIKIKRKEDKEKMDAYKTLLAELENELAEIRNIDVAAKVEERLSAIRVEVMQEELDAKRDAEDKKVAEIDALNRIIARLPVAEEVPVADTPVEEPVAVEASTEVEENIIGG